MRILGIDPGLTRLGFGALEPNSNNLNLLGYGMIAHPRDESLTFNQHLNTGIHQIVTDFPKLIDAIQPTLICAEIVPSGRLGSNSELVVAAITSCKVIAFQFGIEWIDYGANTIKKQTTGDGKATKTVVRNTILDLFPQVKSRHALLKKDQKVAGEKAEGLPQDVFDGIAISLCGVKLNVLEDATNGSMDSAGQAQDS